MNAHAELAIRYGTEDRAPRCDISVGSQEDAQRSGTDARGATSRVSTDGGPAAPSPVGVRDPLPDALRWAPAAPLAAADATLAALARAEREGLVDVAWATADTPIGPLHVAATTAGLVRISFGLGDRDLDDMLEHLARRISPRIVESPARLDAARRQLDEYFEGRRHEFDVPLDWRLSAGFRRRVLEHLVAEVGYGRTVSYLDLAAASGHPRAARAVGSAMATNPIPIVVPCHRVLRTGGRIGGYGGGLPTKVKLLELEGALPAGQQHLL